MSEEWYNFNVHVTSFPGPIPGFSMVHAHIYVEKIEEPGDGAIVLCVCVRVHIDPVQASGER